MTSFRDPLPVRIASADSRRLRWTLPRAGRIGIVWVVAAAFVLCAVLMPPLVQPLAYHAFADARSLLGIPNLWNVATNLPFLLVGAAGLRFVSFTRMHPGFHEPRERTAYAVLFAGVALTCVGSAYYHLAPDNARLVWDRLPMTVGFMALVAATLSERVSVNAGVRLLAPLVALGVASVVWWSVSASMGAENLRPYVFIQFGSIALVLLIAALFPSRYTRAGDMVLVVALYAAAKIGEFLDQALYAAGSIFSGHSGKHLLAAAAVYQILRMLKARTGRDDVAVPGVPGPTPLTR